MTENSDLERYQQLLAQLRAMSDKQMACELECSRLAAENDRLKAENDKLKTRHTKLWNALDFLASKENYEDGVIHTILFVSDEDGWFHPAIFALQALEEDKNE